MNKKPLITIHAVAVSIIAALHVSTASATPITATFDGIVSGATPNFDTVLNSFPVGTHVAFNVNFDEHFMIGGSPTRFYQEVTTGWLDIGANHYSFESDVQGWTSWNFFTGYEFEVDLYGSGPTLADGGQLFGLFLSFSPTLDITDMPFIGFSYPTLGGGTSFSYAQTSGSYAVGPTAIPEPSTALLFLPSLAMLWRARRIRRDYFFFSAASRSSCRAPDNVFPKP